MNATSGTEGKKLDPSHFLCVWCDTDFVPEGPELRCPNCGANDSKDLVAIYVGNDDQLQGMYCPIDWHGG